MPAPCRVADTNPETAVSVTTVPVKSDALGGVVPVRCASNTGVEASLLLPWGSAALPLAEHAMAVPALTDPPDGRSI
jgi:hypothetical protein